MEDALSQDVLEVGALDKTCYHSGGILKRSDEAIYLYKNDTTTQ